MLAAVLVLIPISFVCDFFYSKKEPLKKSGASLVLLVIHAVLFALFCIGSLITAVFLAVLLLTNDNSSATTITAFYSALVITAVYGALFLRTLNPVKLPWIKRFFPLFMIGIVGAISVLGVLRPAIGGPVKPKDEFLGSNNRSLDQGADYYAQEAGERPANPNDGGVE